MSADRHTKTFGTHGELIFLSVWPMSCLPEMICDMFSIYPLLPKDIRNSQSKPLISVLLQLVLT